MISTQPTDGRGPRAPLLAPPAPLLRPRVSSSKLFQTTKNDARAQRVADQRHGSLADGAPRAQRVRQRDAGGVGPRHGQRPRPIDVLRRLEQRDRQQETREDEADRRRRPRVQDGVLAGALREARRERRHGRRDLDQDRPLPDQQSIR